MLTVDIPNESDYNSKIDSIEWHLRFGGGDDPLKCQINGKEGACPDITIRDASLSPSELEQHKPR